MPTLRQGARLFPFDLAGPYGVVSWPDELETMDRNVLWIGLAAGGPGNVGVAAAGDPIWLADVYRRARRDNRCDGDHAGCRVCGLRSLLASVYRGQGR